ncbi:thioredoxin family protein [Yaniella flava]|uniref:Thioredoxin n=1 Tax=Yaniella flava TaxID=287930 RepID=A0ABN2V153_9MICC|nr:thioredoxin fold domain-containing protein [Micrococcaceae bacterium]
MMQQLTLETLGPTVENNATVIVDFWAPWCTTCARFTRIFTDVSHQFEDVVFATVNTDEQQELAAIMGVRSLPTLVAFRNGKHVFAKSGVMSRRQFAEIVEQIRTLGNNPM